MEEKKEIKISLFSFYVLVAGIVVLIGALLIAGIAIVKNSNESYIANNYENNGVQQGGQTSNTENRVLLANDGVLNKESEMYEFPTISRYPNMDNLLEAFGLYWKNGGDMTLVDTDLNNITNAEIFKIATNIAEIVDYDTSALEYKFKDIYLVTDCDAGAYYYTAKDIETAISKVFGDKVSYKHEDWINNTTDYDGRGGAVYLDGSYAVYNYYLGGPHSSCYMLQDITKVEQVGNDIEITVKMADFTWDESSYEYYNDLGLAKIGYNVLDVRGNHIGNIVWDERFSNGYNEDFNFIRQNPSKVDTFKYVFSQDQEDGNYYFNSFKLVK